MCIIYNHLFRYSIENRSNNELLTKYGKNNCNM